MRKITNYHDERHFVLENAYKIAVLVTSGSDYFVRACLACKSDKINRPANTVYLPTGKNDRMINSAIVIGSVMVHENDSWYFIALAENTYEFVEDSRRLDPPQSVIIVPTEFARIIIKR